MALLQFLMCLVQSLHHVHCGYEKMSAMRGVRLLLNIQEQHAYWPDDQAFPHRMLHCLV